MTRDLATSEIARIARPRRGQSPDDRDCPRKTRGLSPSRSAASFCLFVRVTGGHTCPRPRFAPTGNTFHVINRGNDRRRIFFEDADYEAFILLLQRAKEQHAVKVYGLCLMPNHFHALVRPEKERALSAYWQWVQGCYACDLRSQTRTMGYGHVFQRRFWSGGIEDRHHFLTVLRYIEANPVVGHVVRRAEEWQWSSFTLRKDAEHQLLDPLPIHLPHDWSAIVNDAPGPEEPD